MSVTDYEFTQPVSTRGPSGADLGGGSPDSIQFVLNNIAAFVPSPSSGSTPVGTVGILGNYHGYNPVDGNFSGTDGIATVMAIMTKADPPVGHEGEAYYSINHYAYGSFYSSGTFGLTLEDGVTPCSFADWPGPQASITNAGLERDPDEDVHILAFVSLDDEEGPPEGWDPATDLLAPVSIVVTCGTAPASSHHITWADRNFGQAGTRIDRRELPSGDWEEFFMTVGLGDTEADVSPISRFKSYEYKLFATADGNTSDPSNIVVGGPCEVVDHLTVYPAYPMTNDPTLPWTAGGESAFVEEPFIAPISDLWGTGKYAVSDFAFPSVLFGTLNTASIYVNHDFDNPVPIADLPADLAFSAARIFVTLSTGGGATGYKLLLDEVSVGDYLINPEEIGGHFASHERPVPVGPLAELLAHTIGIGFFAAAPNPGVWQLYLETDKAVDPLTMQPETLPGGSVGESYAQGLSGEGGTPPYVAFRVIT